MEGTVTPLEQLLELAQRPGGDPRVLERMQQLAERMEEKALAFRIVGSCLRTRRMSQQAEYWIRRSLAIAPDDAATLNELAATRMDLGRFEDARADLVEVLRLDPALVFARCNLATCLQLLNRLPEALAAYRMAAMQSLEFIYPRVQALTIARQLSNWSYWDSDVAGLIQLEPTGQNSAPQLDLLYLPLTAAHLRRHAECYAGSLQPLPSSGSAPPAANRPIRVGYVSDDLRNHVVGTLLVEVLELHDRRNFEVHVFDWKPASNTVVERRMRRAGVRVHDVSGMSDQQAATFIATRGIDVLVDLKGYSSGHRIGIFRARPAPVQVSWLGYPGTLGDRCIDYIIADPVVLPPESEYAYTESVMRLPQLFFPSDRNRPIGRRSNREAHGLPQDALVYCYLGRSAKITPEIFSDWIGILEAVPESVLWLRADSDDAMRNLRIEARQRGLDEKRLVFARDEHSRTSDLVARYLLADIALDTFPYGSHATASECLWAGCPLVARMGDTFASRVAGSMLIASGLAELVAETREDFRRIAVDLGRDRARISRLRTQLQEGRSSNAAFDTPALVRALETGYRMAVDRCRQGHSPGSIDVPSSLDSILAHQRLGAG